MHNVIYTGIFSINWDYFKGTQAWQIYNLYHMQKYCERHGAELRIIDNSHKKMNEIFDYARKNSDYLADAWNIGTLSSIVALEEFATERKYNKFLWLDADISITMPEYNIFNIINDPIIEVGQKSDNYKKEKFMMHCINTHKVNQYELSCASGIYGMNLDRAIAVIDLLRTREIFPEDYKILINDMIKLYKGDKHFISDECIMEALVNIIKFNSLKDRISIELITESSEKDFGKIDKFCYHFASGTKRLIKEFWNYRNE